MSERQEGSVAKGIALTLALHVLQFFLVPILTFVLSAIPSGNSVGLAIAIGGIGVTQFVYMLPAILKFKKTGEVRTVQGLVIGAAVTFLLCAACDGLLFLPLRKDLYAP